MDMENTAYVRQFEHAQSEVGVHLPTMNAVVSALLLFFANTIGGLRLRQLRQFTALRIGDDELVCRRPAAPKALQIGASNEI